MVGGISVGGVGSVMGAAAIQELPVGVPKIVVAPTASGHHEFGPYVGTKDVMVVHSVVDILGLNPVSTTVFDNVAAAMVGMLAHGHPLTPPAPARQYVATTMLGNTTVAGRGAARIGSPSSAIETVVFHSNGVGGPAMEELAAEGQFVGVIDYTTNEINDPLIGGIHDGGPDRLRRVGRLGLPQVLVPGLHRLLGVGRRLDPGVACATGPSTTTTPSTRSCAPPTRRRRPSAASSRSGVNESTGPRAHRACRTRGLSIPAVARTARSGIPRATPSSSPNCARTFAPTSRSQTSTCTSTTRSSAASSPISSLTSRPDIEGDSMNPRPERVIARLTDRRRGLPRQVPLVEPRATCRTSTSRST